MSSTERIAAFAAGLEHRQIPDAVVERFKALILDGLACGIGGVGTAPGREVAALVEGMGAPGGATVWPTGTSAPTMLAAYANASLANALDFDDTFSGAGHPGATVVPAALALAEERRAAGKDLLAAAVAGYEVTVRLGLAIRPTPRRYKEAFGYGHQTVGAAAAAANILGFAPDTTSTALGLAAVNAPVPYGRKLNLKPAERPLSWVKNNYGWMAMGAVLSSELAQRGFAGPRDVLDGPHGYWTMSGSDRFDESLLLDGIGDEYLSVETEVKPYASCRWTHSAIEAAARLRDRLDGDGAGLLPDDVAEVAVAWFGEVEQFDVAEPLNPVDAQFSLPFLVSAALLGSAPTVPIAESDLADADVLSLARRVSVTTDPMFHEAFATGRDRSARVTVKTAAGRELTETVEVPLGHPTRALGWDTVAAKAEALVGPVLGEEAARRLVGACRDLDAVDDVRCLWAGRG